MCCWRIANFEQTSQNNQNYNNLFIIHEIRKNLIQLLSNNYWARVHFDIYYFNFVRVRWFTDGTYPMLSLYMRRLDAPCDDFRPMFLIINNPSMKNEKFSQERNCLKLRVRNQQLIFIDWLPKHLMTKFSLDQLQDFFPRSIKIWKRECSTCDLLFTMLNSFQYYKYPLPLTFYV